MRYKSKYHVSKCPVRHYGIHVMNELNVSVGHKREEEEEEKQGR